MERTEAELITAVLKGDAESFEPLVQKYSPRVFATARRYARRESEVEDIAQEVWVKAFQKLSSFRGEAPFEHWLMRLAVRICYDFLRGHQRNREMSFSDLSDPESDWLERFVSQGDEGREDAEAAQAVGVPVFRCKMLAVTISAALTALGGVWNAFYYNNLFPETAFAVGRSIEITLSPIIGGLGTLFGPFVGAVVLTGMGEIFTDLSDQFHIPGLKQIFYGLALMIIVMYRPAGIWPWIATRLGFGESRK